MHEWSFRDREYGRFINFFSGFGAISLLMAVADSQGGEGFVSLIFLCAKKEKKKRAKGR